MPHIAMPAIWGGESLPEHLSRDEAIAFASRRAVERHFTYVLMWSRKEEIWCYPEGNTRVVTMEVACTTDKSSTSRSSYRAKDLGFYRELDKTGWMG